MHRKLLVLLALASMVMLPAIAASAGDAPQSSAPSTAGATPAPQCSDAELSADVPALFDFHEVIMPLWHDAWPNKDLDLMRKLMPQIQEHVASVQKAELPGILRDKREKWDAGVARVAAQANALEGALKADQQQPAMDAAEALHADFEGLVRLVRPRMKELEAYHQLLYRVYHYDWPNRDLAALAGHADDMASACAPLAAAAVPKRFEAKEAGLRQGFAALCAATGELKAACGGTPDDKTLGAAVEKVHDAYRACEQLFD